MNDDLVLVSRGNPVSPAAPGQPAKARELYERAQRILHTHFPGGHPRIATLARNMRAVAPDVIVLDNGLIGRAERQDNSRIDGAQ